jgi:AcrR family transcriptional regulator
MLSMFRSYPDYGPLMADGTNTASGGSVPVPMRPPGRRRRRDAARNRDHVLDVARRLAGERGLAAVTMDLLAAEAGVGKGTLYRGFGNRAGLAQALVDEAERELQERILSGPPPLGWGAPAGERVAAFFDAYLELLADNVDLLVETERGTPGSRFHTGAYAFWHAHVTALLRQTGRDDPGPRAHALLALVAADLYQHMEAGGIGPDRIRSAVLATVTGAIS